MKKLLVLAVTVAAVAIVAVPALAATKRVNVGDNYFVQKHGSHKVTINKGATVKWVWVGHKRHSVYQLAGPGHFHLPASGNGRKSGSEKHKFTHKGTYTFVCTFHSSMKMTVKVK